MRPRQISNQAEARLDVPALVRRGVETAALERYHYANGRAERVESVKSANA